MCTAGGANLDLEQNDALDELAMQSKCSVLVAEAEHARDGVCVYSSSTLSKLPCPILKLLQALLADRWPDGA